jgi:hypothetical protein
LPKHIGKDVPTIVIAITAGEHDNTDIHITSTDRGQTPVAERGRQDEIMSSINRLSAMIPTLIRTDIPQ